MGLSGRTHWTHQDFSVWMISSTHGPLPDETQHSQETEFHAPAGFEPHIPASERPQTHTLDGATTGIGRFWINIGNFNASNNKTYYMTNMKQKNTRGYRKNAHVLLFSSLNYTKHLLWTTNEYSYIHISVYISVHNFHPERDEGKGFLN